MAKHETSSSNPSSNEVSSADAIVVRGASTHNLKAIDCHIPHGKVTVVTGLSGAGKSSLAFDTVYAEAQRRFVESMSTYARQFLDQMERPPVEAVDGVLPAVALEARNAVKNARSTVGTITEVHDVLRLLFAHLGTVTCPNGHGPVAGFTGEQAADSLAAEGGTMIVVAELPRPGRQANDKLRELIRQGYFRRLDEASGKDGKPEVVRMTPSARWTRALDPLPILVGRFRVKAAKEGPSRLVSAIEEAYSLTGGKATVIVDRPSSEIGAAEPEAAGGERRHFGRALTCTTCGTQLREPQPALFSFNSPLGACETCEGFGRVVGIDPERVIPDPSKSLSERPIAPWNSPAYEDLYDPLFAACKAHDVPLDVPWKDLPAAAQDFVWRGGHGSSGRRFKGIDHYFARLERRSYRMHLRILLARYRSYDECPDCEGRRLRPEALAVTIAGKSIADLSALSIEKLRTWLRTRRFTRAQRARARLLLEQLQARVDTLHQVGLDYLSLSRQSRTLSGGESQRIHLATALGNGLTSTLYVLDEPTIGLHPRDSDRLLSLLQDLATRGNTVLVVEHDRTLIAGADHVIDLGPHAGERGGEVIAEGTFEQILESDVSMTAAYMRERQPTPARAHVARFRRERRRDQDEAIRRKKRIRIRGASANNLRGIDVDLPLGALTAVTGVSGSGKSTLVQNVLHGTYQRRRGVVDVTPGDCTSLEGMEAIEDVVMVDQRPLGRSSRSNPVTFLKAYDDIRKLFASTEDARRVGITPGDFSFNLDRGRCPACMGTGVLDVDMQFMAPVSVVCDTCQGRRFKPEILAITLFGRNIHETLEITVDEALEVFADQTRLVRRLEALTQVGLGYLRLGQPTSTLSGGEAQRLKLASFLITPGSARTSKGKAAGGKRKRSAKNEAAHRASLYLFDEPTTGLHLADIDLLYNTLRRLVARGDGVVVVEHSTDLVARADWIVDLGPGGGAHGGELLFAGPLESFLDTAESPTAEVLRDHLRWSRKATAR